MKSEITALARGSKCGGFAPETGEAQTSDARRPSWLSRYARPSPLMLPQLSNRKSRRDRYRFIASSHVQEFVQVQHQLGEVGEAVGFEELGGQLFLRGQRLARESDAIS